MIWAIAAGVIAIAKEEAPHRMDAVTKETQFTLIRQLLIQALNLADEIGEHLLGAQIDHALSCVDASGERVSTSS